MSVLPFDKNSFYMFAGGTNFGFMGGANYGKSYSPRLNIPIRYIPHSTSYDCNSLIGENSRPTEKYFLCRDVLDEYLGRYDSADPQMTLYVPGALLKESDNELIVLDIDPTGDRSCISFSDHEILEGDSIELL